MQDSIINDVCKRVEDKYINGLRDKCTSHVATFVPTLMVLLSENPTDDDESYLKQLERLGRKYGCAVYSRYLPLLNAKQYVAGQSMCPTVDGILVASDFDGQAAQVTNLIPRHLDIDGNSQESIGWFYGNDGADQFVSTPSTALAAYLVIQEVMGRLDDTLCGKRVAIINRSKKVGKPLAEVLTNADATVTVFHSKSKLPRDGFRNFDIVCSAIGKPKFFDSTDFDDGLVLIDIGISVDEDGVVWGDFDYDALKKDMSYVTPVPGGIGKVTSVCTFAKLFKHAAMRMGVE